jgi:hypothetical protein
MILLLLTYSTSWSQNNIEQDSVLVPLSAIKTANAKMIELEYEKQLNRELLELSSNDSILIDALYTNAYNDAIVYENNIKKVKNQRNMAITIGSGSSLILLLLLILL